jgi:ribosomal protein L40E
MEKIEMALTACKECGNEISTKAKSCPKCGQPQSRGIGRKILKWMLVAIFAVPVIAITGAWLRHKAVGPERWLRDGTEEYIKARLIDPSSFAIRDAYYIRRPLQEGGTLIMLCGVFDAKNMIGGFSGGTRFVARGVYVENAFDIASVNFEDAEKKRTADRVNQLSPFEAVYWNGNCVDASHPALEPKKDRSS